MKLFRRLLLLFLLAFADAAYPRSCSAALLDSPIEKNVMIMTFNPVVTTGAGNQKLSQALGYDDPKVLEQQMIAFISQVSNGLVHYKTTVRVDDIDEWPVKKDGFVYTYQTWQQCMQNHALCHMPDTVDYVRYLNRYQVCERLNRGEIDELWIYGFPYMGSAEAAMTGKDAFYTNDVIVTGSTCGRPLHMMGFSYEPPFYRNIEDFGHRIEHTIEFTYGNRSRDGSVFTPIDTPWLRYSGYELTSPGRSGCGDIHHPPNFLNSAVDRDYSSTTGVQSTCEDWVNYPDLTGTTTDIGCSVWNCNPSDYFTWWFRHIPKYTGIDSQGKWNNWWKYISSWGMNCTGKLAFADDARNTAGNYYLITTIPANSPLPQNQTFVYLNRLENHTNYAATGIYATDVLPENIVFIDAPNTCTYTASTRTVRCSVGNIPVGSRSSIAYRVRVTGYVPTINSATEIITGQTTAPSVCKVTHTMPDPTRTLTPTLTVTSTPVSKPGDADGDNRVDGQDYVIWLNHYGTTPQNGPRDGDFNANGKVDGQDYVIWISHYGT